MSHLKLVAQKSKKDHNTEEVEVSHVVQLLLTTGQEVLIKVEPGMNPDTPPSINATHCAIIHSDVQSTGDVIGVRLTEFLPLRGSSVAFQKHGIVAITQPNEQLAQTFMDMIEG